MTRSDYVVMDKTGFPWGPFKTAHAAGVWAERDAYKDKWEAVNAAGRL